MVPRPAQNLLGIVLRDSPPVLRQPAFALVVTVNGQVLEYRYR
jgi:hypothetical protein